MHRVFWAVVTIAGCSGDDSLTDASGDTGRTDIVDSGMRAPRPLDLTLLHVNDTHSHLAASTFSFDVSGLPLAATRNPDGDPVQTVDVTYGGFPLLTSLLRERASAAGHSVSLHAGDAIPGSPTFTLFDGAADAALMNEICFDALAIGDGELSRDQAGLSSFLDQVGQDGCGTVPVSVNLPPPVTKALSAAVSPLTILRLQGHQIAVVGLSPVAKLSDAIDLAQAQIDSVRSKGVDKIIVLSHIGSADDLAMARALSGVDVVVGGHSHTLLGSPGLGDLGFPVEGDYPTTAENADGDTVCIVQAWDHAHGLGELILRFDEQGDVLSCEGSPLFPVDLTALSYRFVDATGETTRTLGPEDSAVAGASLVDSHSEMVATQPDVTSQRLLNRFEADAAARMGRVIGNTTETLCVEGFPGEARSGTCARAETFALGSAAANRVAAAFLRASSSAQVAILHAGGVHTDIVAGSHTLGQALSLLDPDATLVTLPMTGQQIRSVLEEALAHHLDDAGTTDAYPYSSGLRFDVDASAAAGSRVSNLEINPRIAGTWSAIEPATEYTVVTSSTLAAGREGYATFGAISAAGIATDTFSTASQAWVDDVRAAGVIEPVPLSEGSTQSYIGRDGCLHIPANLDVCSTY